MTVRHTFEAASFDDAAHMLRAGNGVYCFVCRRQPWPKHLTYKHLAVCGRDAASAAGREKMNDVSDQEKLALRDGIDRGGSYLETIGEFDLTKLTQNQADTFAAHFLCGYSESMSERAAKAPPF